MSQISRRHPLKASKSLERGWMTQMQLPAMLSTHPHYSLFSHLGLRVALGTETLLFSPGVPLWETERLQHTAPHFLRQLVGLFRDEHIYIPHTSSQIFSPSPKH